jgi:hypothetical protein
MVSSTELYSQGWTWEWATRISNSVSNVWIDIDHCDILNNVYSVSPYDSVFIISDTVFYHPEQIPDNYNNKAILIHNSEGEFINALDLYTIPDGGIYYPNIGTDLELNLYISCSFQIRMFVQDTIINHCNTPYIYAPDGVIIKLNDQLDIVWASLIGGTNSDDILEQIINWNGDIFILSYQEGRVERPTTVSFFGQDTVYSDQDFNSVTMLDKDGVMIWRDDIYLDDQSAHMTLGQDSLLYLWGASYSDIIYNGDTIFKPVHPGIIYEPYIIILNLNGMVEEIKFIDYHINPVEMEVNGLGEFYITSYLWDTVIINQDTIIVPEDLAYSFLGKFDSLFQPLWYYVIPETNTQQVRPEIKLDENNLIFVIRSNDDLQIADTILPMLYGYEAFTGEFDDSGDLVYITRTETTRELRALEFILDNCKNPVISGDFRGICYLGEDTLDSYSNYISDGFIAKLIRNEPENIDLGPDTTACEQFILAGPEDYTFFSLNECISAQNGFTITESGIYRFGCADENGCWVYDTIDINIHPGFEIDLGADTIIKVRDTIIFTIPSQFQSYLWSNGASSNSITIIGSDYGEGTFPIWVEVTDGPCTVTDTVYVTIKDDFGIEEYTQNSIHVFPNPFTDKVTIDLKPDYQTIEIRDLNGTVRFFREIIPPKNGQQQIELRNLSRGIYLIRIKTGAQSLTKKIVKL